MTWFVDGDAYAAGRPTYPAELAPVLADLAPARDLAVDVGCGTGQLSVLLAEHVDSVIGVDPSGSQIDAVLALITYGVVALDDDLTDRFGRFYTDEIGPYWPPERAHVDAGYTDLPFPFERIDVAAPPIERDWTLDEFVEYLHTWSAMRRAGASGPELVAALRADLAPVWGESRRVTWPITVLAGRVA